MFDPVVCLRSVECELKDCKEKAPDEDILLAARDLDAIDLVGPRVVALAAQDFAGEAHSRTGDLTGPVIELEADLEVEVRVAVQQWADPVLNLELVSPTKKLDAALSFSDRYSSFSRSLSQEKRSSVKALKYSVSRL